MTSDKCVDLSKTIIQSNICIHNYQMHLLQCLAYSQHQINAEWLVSCTHFILYYVLKVILPDLSQNGHLFALFTGYCMSHILIFQLSPSTNEWINKSWSSHTMK